MSNWMNLPIHGQAAWPTEDFLLVFEDCEILLRPAKKDTEQSVHVDLGRYNKEVAITAINRFLSILSWCEHVPMRIWWERGGFSGSPIPVPIYRDTTRSVGSCICNYPFFRKLDQNPKAVLALALYREALTAISIPFEYLGYFKILNVKWKDKYVEGENELIEGIRSTLPLLTEKYVVERIKKLSIHEGDFPKYLYQYGRCAIAHAFAEPLVDPDDWRDNQRLAAELPIIRALAEHVIHEMGVSDSILG
jgi:hypothetical protein